MPKSAADVAGVMRRIFISRWAVGGRPAAPRNPPARRGLVSTIPNRALLLSPGFGFSHHLRAIIGQVRRAEHWIAMGILGLGVAWWLVAWPTWPTWKGGLILAPACPPSAPGPALGRPRAEVPEQGFQEVDRHREDGRRVVLRSDLHQGLQEAELERDRLLRHDRRRLGEPLRRLVLPLRGDHFGPAFAFRLRLPGHRPAHLLGEIDVLDGDLNDLDAPRIRVLVDDRLKVRVDLLAFGEELVQLRLPAHATQRRLRILRGGEEEVL